MKESPTTDRSPALRCLSPSEQTYARSEIFVGYSVTALGRLDTAALTVAFSALCCAHPILKTRLAAAGSGHDIVAAPDPVARMSVRRGDPGDPSAVTGLDQRAGVCVLDVVHDDATASITLFTHHSIADAGHSVALLSELLSWYTDAARGAAIDVTPGRYPDPVETLFAARGIAVPDRPPAPAAVTGHRATGSVARPAMRWRLTRTETTALTDRARREQVTVTGVVNAVILGAEARVRGMPTTNGLICSYPVDLRSRVTPRIGPAEGTDVLGFTAYAPSEDDDDDDIVGTARAIARQLRTELGSGAVHASATRVPEAPDHDLPDGLVLTSSWGVIPAMRTPEPLRVADFRSVTTGRPVTPGDGGVLTYFFSTYGGRLAIEVHHTPRLAAAARQRLAVVRARLTEFITALSVHHPQLGESKS